MLTNQEKIELRELAFRLANEFCEQHIINEAELIYQFLSKGLDDDPLRLDTPSPGYNEKVERWAIAISEELKKQKTEIDWSRPQLVQWAGDTLILQTNGTHGPASMEYPSGWFEGTVLNKEWGSWKSGESSKWEKERFVYHGEIQKADNQKISARQDCNGIRYKNAIQCFEKSHIGANYAHSRGSNVVMPLKDFMGFLKIAAGANEESPQEQQEEPKTTGMTFLEMVSRLEFQKNHAERLTERPTICNNNKKEVELNAFNQLVRYKNSPCSEVLHIEDFLATDWQIIN